MRAKRFDRVFDGVGRIRNSSGVVVYNKPTQKEFERRDTILTRLFQNGQLGVLRAFQAGTISIEQLIEADREGSILKADLLSDVKLREFLWHRVKGADRKGREGFYSVICPRWRGTHGELLAAEDETKEHTPECLGAVDKALPRMGKSPETRRRYKTSFTKLRESGFVEADARVSELAHIDGRELRSEWEGSAADWNHLIRALSGFLTVHFGGGRRGKAHPFRLEVLDQFQMEDEGEGRLVDLSVDQFFDIVNRTPEHARPCYVALAVTGLRIGEYVRVGKEHVNFEACTIRVPGGKTGRRPIRFAEDYREWMRQAIPSPLKAGWMRIYWVRARKEVGRDDVWLRDLRHCTAQWGMDEGATEVEVSAQLGHTNTKTTRKYTRQANRGQTAQAVARALGKAKVVGSITHDERKIG